MPTHVILPSSSHVAQEEADFVLPMIATSERLQLLIFSSRTGQWLDPIGPVDGSLARQDIRVVQHCGWPGMASSHYDAVIALGAG